MVLRAATTSRPISPPAQPQSTQTKETDVVVIGSGAVNWSRTALGAALEQPNSCSVCRHWWAELCSYIGQIWLPGVA